MIDVTKFEGHAPGPWRVHGNIIRAHVWIMTRAIAECYCDDATMQLFAAAPELLAEVKRLMERVKELETRTPKCAKCCGRGEVRGPSDSGYMDCPACDGKGN